MENLEKEKTKMLGIIVDETTLTKINFIKNVYHIRSYNEVVRFLINNPISVDKYYEMSILKNKECQKPLK